MLAHGRINFGDLGSVTHLGGDKNSKLAAASRSWRQLRRGFTCRVPAGLPPPRSLRHLFGRPLLCRAYRAPCRASVLLEFNPIRSPLLASVCQPAQVDQP